MLALTLMVAIAAIAWPALDKPFAARRLRTSADQLRAEMARGRVAAMQSGRVHVFTVEPTTGRFQIHPADEAAATAATATEATSTPTNATVLPGHSLPDGIRLQEVLSVDDVTPLPPQLAPQQQAAPVPQPATSGLNGATDAAAMTGAAQNVYFHPDGTTSSARFTLANQHGATLVMELRGLTGSTRISATAATGATP